MQRIYEHICKQCQSANFINDLLRIDKWFLELTKVYAKASFARESLTDAQANVRADEVHAKNEKELQERLSRPQ